MIKYERLQQVGDGPRDVRVKITSTDEIDRLASTFRECDGEEMTTYQNLISSQETGDTSKQTFEFIIPGNEVGECTDLFWDIDNGKLENLTDQWNSEMIQEVED